MARRGRSALCLFSALLLIVLAAVLSLTLIDNTSRWRFASSDGGSEGEKMKQVALVSELQALSKLANRTVEEIAVEVLTRQENIKASFCTRGELTIALP